MVYPVAVTEVCVCFLQTIDNNSMDLVWILTKFGTEMVIIRVLNSVRSKKPFHFYGDFCSKLWPLQCISKMAEMISWVCGFAYLKGISATNFVSIRKERAEL